MEQIDKYYKILGLNPGASEEEVREAHKRLLNVWRPDRFSDDSRLKENANERLREINIAFGNLISSMNQEIEGNQTSEKQDHAGPHSPPHEPPPRSEKANYTSDDKGPEESEPPPKKPFGQPPVKAMVLARPEGVRSWVTTTIIGGSIVILLVGISILVLNLPSFVNLQGVRDARDTQTTSVPPSNMKGMAFIDPLEVEQKQVIPQEAPTPPVPSPAEVALTPGQVFDKVKDSIVVVKTLDAQGKEKSQGSGVLLPSGKIATNCHVVEGSDSYLVGRGKEFVRATLYAEDGDKDICLLDARGITGEPVQLGKAASLKVGDPVYAVGAPQGQELSLSDGIVAQLRDGRIQNNAAISLGSSGGGLFDREGRLVGLTTFYLEGGQSLNFAIPVEWIGEVKPGRKPATGGRSRTEWYQRATALEQMKDWQGLLDWCRKWTESEPKNDNAWNNLGATYGKLNLYNDAIEAFRQALRINPELAEAWNNLGFTYGKLNLYNDAIEAYRQALRINPEDANVWDKLGFAYGEVNRYNNAIEAYRQNLRINPESAIAWYNLGIAYVLSGNRTAALDAVHKLRHLDPALADKLFNTIVPR